MRILILLISLLSWQAAYAQESFRLPPNPKLIIVTYLERMKVKDTNRQLSDNEKHELCRLFVKAYVISIRKHRQDYMLPTAAPIYRLLASNFPGIKAREGEGGSIVFLGAITSFFNSFPEYREDVIRVLRDGISREYCKP